MTRAYGRLPKTEDHRDYQFRAPRPYLGQFVDLSSQFPGVPYDQGQLGSCFPPGTRVRMADGSERPIEAIRLLDKVLTAEGNIGTVTATMVREETGGLVRLRLGGHRHLRCTREHPILTARGYVPAGELRIRDEVALPRYTPSVPTGHIATVDYARRYKVGSITLPEKIELTPAFGRLMGLWLAEGSADGTKVRWNYGSHEEATLVPETVALVRETLGVEAHAARRPNGTWWVTLYGMPWNELFKAMGGQRGEVKCPAPVLCSGSREFLEAMLDGWLAGDGHTTANGTIQGVTVSADLALAMYDIAQAIGRRPVITSSEPGPNAWAKTRRTRWDVKMAPGGSENYSRQDDAHVWRRIRELVVEDYIGPVYDLTVETDHSYVAEGIGAHNCVSNGTAAIIDFARQKQGLHPLLNPSRLFLYYQGRARSGQPIDEDTGLEVRDGLTVAAKDGAPPETDWPYDVARFTQKPPGRAYTDARGDVATVYGAVDAADIDSTIASGYPIIFGVDLWESFESDAVANTGVVPVPDKSRESQVGGHCMVIVSTGKDGSQIPHGTPGTRSYRVRNSWGTGWGDGGYCWMPEAIIKGPDASDYWMLTAMSDPHGPTPPPGPPPLSGSLGVAVQALVSSPAVAAWLRAKHSGLPNQVAALVHAVVEASQAA